MSARPRHAWVLAGGLLWLSASCAPGSAPQPRDDQPLLVEGARLIDGSGSAPIERSALLIEHGRISRVGRQGDVKAPQDARRIDLAGKTVIPALIDAHSHLGYTDVAAMTTSAANYTRNNLTDHLRRYAYYGIAATLSMGVDRGDLPYELRSAPPDGAALFRTAGRGIALPNAGPGAEYRRDAAYGVTSEKEARGAVRDLAARNADIVKIWVDDRDGTVPKLPPPLYRAIIDEAHAHGLRVVAHIFDLADAKELLRSGVDGFAHGVRDRDIDDEFVALIKERPRVFVIPNLPDRDADDDFTWLADTVPHAEIERLRTARDSRSAAAAQQARDLYGVQARNLARLDAAGARIGFGTDAGVSVGWTAHTELADMVAAGMSPARVLVAATQTSAKIMGLDELGTLAPGKRADFIVLEANPLDDITNTRRIAAVFLAGRAIDRPALSAVWTGGRQH